MSLKYTSIRSVLYDLLLTIDDRYWNETHALEFASRAARKIRAFAKLEDVVCTIPLTLHKADLPKDLYSLTQVAYYSGDIESCPDASYLALPTTSDLANKLDYLNRSKWTAMRLSSNPYHDSILCDYSIKALTDCEHEFTVSTSLTLTSTLDYGTLLVAYKRFPVDEEGLILIPDEEDYKEAILHYVLYRYWLSKYQMKEEGAEQRMKEHRAMWNTLSVKALNINLPDVNTLENIKANQNRLVPRTNKFQQLFTTLGNRENVDF